MIKKRKNLFQDHNKKRDLTSLREFSSSQVLKKIWHLQPIIGISRLANLTDFNRLKLPIVSAMRTNVDKSQITSTQGKGRTFREAMCGALMENIERFSASKYEGDFFKDKFSNLKDNGIKAINPIDFYYPEKSLEEVQDWISGTHLTTGEHYLIPAAEILFPYHPKHKSSLYIKPHTSSLAAGMSLEEATIHSLIETIERYSTSLFHLEHDDPTLASFIPKKGVKDKECLDLLNQLESIGANIIILEVKSPLPTYFVSLLDSSSLGPPMTVAGTGCSLFPNKALKSALLEAIQGMVVTIQGTREDLKRREEDYKGEFYKEEDNFQVSLDYFRENLLNSSMQNYEGPSSFHSFSQILDFIQTKCEEYGTKDMFMVDLTHPKIGIPVVKTIIPGMYDFFINPRIFDGEEK